MIVARDLHVRINGVQPELALLFAAIAFIECRLMDAGELMLTSVTDGRHGENSLHYPGFAADIDFHDAGRFPWIAGKLRERLTVEFDVVPEGTHIHVEFQPKRSDRQAEVDHAWK